MDKRYQVFVSSTFQDLQEERSAVIQVLLESGCIPAGMELFPAGDDSQWELIKRVIDESDYYLVIVAGRYGSIAPDGVGYTEKEYDYAISQKKPVAGFVHADPGKIAQEKCDSDAVQVEQLKKFREKVQQKIIKKWTSAEDLAGKVSIAINHLKSTKPAEGWVKARHASDPQAVLQLRSRIDELESELNAVRTAAPIGTADLAQGDDEYTFTVGVHYYVHYKHTSNYFEDDLTWNEIIAVLGPMMLNEASESSMQTALANSMFAPDDLIPKEATNIKQLISDQTFHTVIVQLFALGIIARSTRKHTASDKDSYWQLTPYGEKTLMTIKAVRREFEF